jgi:hypothetical protein
MISYILQILIMTLGLCIFYKHKAGYCLLQNAQYMNRSKYIQDETLMHYFFITMCHVMYSHL